MKSLFETTDRNEILSRLEALQPGAPRQWGKMAVGQMMKHCSVALEVGAGAMPSKQAFIGKILSPFVRKGVLGEKPFSKNSPTDPKFVIRDDRDFEKERSRLKEMIAIFVERGPANAGRQVHSFFGKMTGEEWGQLMYKHLDHHLRQFGS
jgi:hypothetical protein